MPAEPVHDLKTPVGIVLRHAPDQDHEDGNHGNSERDDDAGEEILGGEHDEGGGGEDRRHEELGEVPDEVGREIIKAAGHESHEFGRRGGIEGAGATIHGGREHLATQLCDDRIRGPVGEPLLQRHHRHAGSQDGRHPPDSWCDLLPPGSA